MKSKKEEVAVDAKFLAECKSVIDEVAKQELEKEEAMLQYQKEVQVGFAS